MNLHDAQVLRYSTDTTGKMAIAFLALQTQYLEAMIEKYTSYMNNIKWHLETNKAYLKEGEEVNCRKRISDMAEFIEDLRKLLNV